MNLIFDIVLAVVMTAIIIISYKKGFIASLLSLASVITASFCAWIFHSPLAGFLSENIISSPLINTIQAKIRSFSSNGDLETLFSDMPEKLESFLLDHDIDPERVKKGFEATEISASEYLDRISEEIGMSLAHVFSVGIAMLMIFLVSYAACLVISFLINSLFKLPVLKQVNSLLSLLIGIVGAVLFAWLFSQCTIRLFDGLCVLYPETFNSDQGASSFLINFFYNLNPYTLFSR